MRAALGAAGEKAVFAIEGISTRQSSGKETWQAPEDGSQDVPVVTRRRHMQPDLGFHLNHAGRRFALQIRAGGWVRMLIAKLALICATSRTQSLVPPERN
jgi:hypothetical protein